MVAFRPPPPTLRSCTNKEKKSYMTVDKLVNVGFGYLNVGVWDDVGPRNFSHFVV